MGEYDGIRERGIALIKRKGRDVVLLRMVEATPADAALPWRVGAGTNTEFPCKGVVYDDDLADGPPDKIAIVPGDCGVVPDENMRCQVGSDQYQIMGVKSYDPDGTPIGFKMRMRLWPSTSSLPRT